MAQSKWRGGSEWWEAASLVHDFGLIPWIRWWWYGLPGRAKAGFLRRFRRYNGVCYDE